MNEQALAGFVLLTFIAEHALEKAHHWLSKSPRARGLLTALTLLKEELLGVGFVSIFLVSVGATHNPPLFDGSRTILKPSPRSLATCALAVCACV